MKQSFLLSLVFLALVITACQQEKAAGVDLEALKQTLNADPEFESTANAFREHTYRLTQINGEELKVIHKMAHNTGIPGERRRRSSITGYSMLFLLHPQHVYTRFPDQSV